MLKAKKGSNFRQIVKAFPELEDDEDLKSAANSLDELQSLAVLAGSEGGKVLLGLQKSKASGLLRQIVALSKVEHSHESLLGMIARLDACMDIVETLSMAIYNSDQQQEFVDEIVERAAT